MSRERVEQRLREIRAEGYPAPESGFDDLERLLRLYRLLEDERDAAEVPVPLDVVIEWNSTFAHPDAEVVRGVAPWTARWVRDSGPAGDGLFLRDGRGSRSASYRADRAPMDLRSALDRVASRLLDPAPTQAAAVVAAINAPAPAGEPSQDLLRRALERVVGRSLPRLEHVEIMPRWNGDRDWLRDSDGGYGPDAVFLQLRFDGSVVDFGNRPQPDYLPLPFLYHPEVLIRRTTWESALAAVQGEAAPATRPWMSSGGMPFRGHTERRIGFVERAPDGYSVRIIRSTGDVAVRAENLGPNGFDLVAAAPFDGYVSWEATESASTLDLTTAALAGDTSAAAALGERAARLPGAYFTFARPAGDDPEPLRARVAALLGVDLSGLTLTTLIEDYAAETVRISGFCPHLAYAALLTARTRPTGQRIRRLEASASGQSSDLIGFEMTVYLGELDRSAVPAPRPGYVCDRCARPCEIDLVGTWPRPHSRCCGVPASSAGEGPRTAAPGSIPDIQQQVRERFGFDVEIVRAHPGIARCTMPYEHRDRGPELIRFLDQIKPVGSQVLVEVAPRPRHAGVAATQAEQAARAAAPMPSAPEPLGRFALLEIDADQPGEAEARARYLAEEQARLARRGRNLPRWTPPVREPVPEADRFALLEPREEPLPAPLPPPRRRPERASLPPRTAPAPCPQVPRETPAPPAILVQELHPGHLRMLEWAGVELRPGQN